MKVYLIRHGQTELNKKHLINGQLEDNLTPEGIEQAELAKSLIPKTVKHIYSSPLRRAKDTALILNSELNAELSFHDELKEVNFGLLSGTDFTADVKKAHVSMQYDWHSHNGESVDDVKNRVLRFLKTLKATKEGESLIVAHGGIIRLLYFLEQGKLMEEIGNVSLHSFDLDKILD
ncbi:MAG: histidine phosphatase family protein [Patescibacteria group bacterium]